jgi:hypothetical protein
MLRALANEIAGARGDERHGIPFSNAALPFLGAQLFQDAYTLSFHCSLFDFDFVQKPSTDELRPAR